MLLLMLISAVAWSQEKVVVIAHKGVSVDSLSRSDLRSLFGMRSRSWPDNQPVRVFVLRDDDPIHEQFVKSKLKTFPYNLRKIWDRRVFSGTGQYPTQVNSAAEMYEMVTTVENSIGYIPVTEIGEGVKVLELRDR